MGGTSVGFLTDWLTNIILLILLATILEMLLPRSAMQRYVKMVVSILLLFIILQPLLSIFTNDMEQFVLQMTNETFREESKLTNSINLQKREIEHGQRAYISEQIAVQLENQVKEGLREEYGLEIAQLDVELEDDPVAMMTEQGIKAVHVQVQTISEEEKDFSQIEQVEMVQIDTAETFTNSRIEQKEEGEQLQQFLAHHWQIPEEQILLTGREGNVYDE